MQCKEEKVHPITTVRTRKANEEIHSVLSFSLLFSLLSLPEIHTHFILVSRRFFALSSSANFSRSQAKMNRNTYRASAQDALPKIPLLCPVITLVLWSFVMMIWLYVKRIPAFKRINFEGKIPNQLTKSQFDALLPAEVRWSADNYNHLMEQPTLFYAVVGALAVCHDTNQLNLFLAWAYVLVRIVHSLLHATYNPVWWRFIVFMIASILLFLLSVRTAFLVFLE